MKINIVEPKEITLNRRKESHRSVIHWVKNDGFRLAIFLAVLISLSLLASQSKLQIKTLVEAVIIFIAACYVAYWLDFFERGIPRRLQIDENSFWFKKEVKIIAFNKVKEVLLSDLKIMEKRYHEIKIISLQNRLDFIIFSDPEDLSKIKSHIINKKMIVSSKSE